METNVQDKMNKYVVHDLDRCIECRSCAAACYYSHADMPAIHFARSGWAALPTVCRQCKAAACVEACPNEAMVRDENGVVRRLMFRCTGCGSCAAACPFGIISAELTGKPAASKSPERMSGHQVGKCDLCMDRIDRDGIPRCVAACPAGALFFVDAEKPDSEHLEIIGGRTTCENPFKRR